MKAEAGLEAAPSPGETLGQILRRLEGSRGGLTGTEAAARLARTGANRLTSDHGTHPLAIIARQLRSPMMLILLAAAGLSFALGEAQQAAIVAVIVFASIGLGFYQEYRAGNAVAELRRRIAVEAIVLRDGKPQPIPAEGVVPGDVLVLKAGSLIPADGIVVDADALNVDEAVLTGESFPASKSAVADGIPGPGNLVHMGTSVRSGDGRVIVTETGGATEFARIAASVARFEPETSFARGIRQFGLLMTQVMLVIVTLVLAANVALGRPVLDSLLFAAALAVGMTPEMLPAIVTVTLAQGARRLTEKGVLVQRLVAIENLGAMDVLCTDKTGTLTEGEVRLSRAVDAAGLPSDRTLRWAAINASLQSTTSNPLDDAILAAQPASSLAAAKLGEVPYDFERRRLSVLAMVDDVSTLIAKGAVGSILPLCGAVIQDGAAVPFNEERQRVEEKRLADYGAQGFRVLAVATRAMPGAVACSGADERALVLEGYLVFADPLKPGIADVVKGLRDNGISLQILTGDNRFIARHVAEAVGLTNLRVVTGAQIERAGERHLVALASRASVFAEVTPSQKERIVAALRKAGRTVGYLGDGINDAPALRAADIGISVDDAVDAARAAADVVLLRRDLGVLLDGVIAGRTAFGNTIKYIGVTISANLGNMISMAVASVLLPFLPMLATQILLNNSLSDLPMLAISTDRVDADALARPHRWEFRALLRSMLGFGLLSSLFDLVTFVVLLWVFHANAAMFQTGWFVESLLTELAVVAVMRTRARFFASLPSRTLILTSIVVASVAVLLPYLPFAAWIGMVPLPPQLMATILGIVVLYALASELLKGRIGLLGSAPVRASAPLAADRHR